MSLIRGVDPQRITKGSADYLYNAVIKFTVDNRKDAWKTEDNLFLFVFLQLVLPRSSRQHRVHYLLINNANWPISPRISAVIVKTCLHIIFINKTIALETRLSCNDLKLHGLRAGNKYDEDGFQMMKLSDAQYLPVYCDMTTAKGAFTLIVTSAHNNWTRAQVPRRWPSVHNSLEQLIYLLLCFP